MVMTPPPPSFEKMISGMYIGELVRLAVLQRAQAGEVTVVPEHFSNPNSFDGAVVSQFIR